MEVFGFCFYLVFIFSFFLQYIDWCVPCFQYDVVFSLTVCLFLLAVGARRRVFFNADFQYGQGVITLQRSVHSYLFNDCALACGFIYLFFQFLVNIKCFVAKGAADDHSQCIHFNIDPLQQNKLWLACRSSFYVSLPMMLCCCSENYY